MTKEERAQFPVCISHGRNEHIARTAVKTIIWDMVLSNSKMRAYMNKRPSPPPPPPPPKVGTDGLSPKSLYLHSLFFASWKSSNNFGVARILWNTRLLALTHSSISLNQNSQSIYDSMVSIYALTMKYLIFPYIPSIEIQLIRIFNAELPSHAVKAQQVIDKVWA